MKACFKKDLDLEKQQKNKTAKRKRFRELYCYEFF